MDCTDFIKGSTCSMNGYCECAPYFVQYNVTSCLSSQLLGGDCILADQCTMKVANSSCLDGACRCVEGFLQFRKHTCLGPAHPGAVCYSHAHCQMNDRRSHCDFLIPNLFGRCQCTAPAKQYGGMCIGDESSVEADAIISQTTTYKPIITPPPTVFRPIDLISHYESSTQGKPLLNNNEISSTENQVEFTKEPVPISSSSEQTGGEDLTAETESMDILDNYHIQSSTSTPSTEVVQQAVTSDDYPYKIDNEEQSEDQVSINEEEIEQSEENRPSEDAEHSVEETNEVTKLESEILAHEETVLELKPSDEDQSKPLDEQNTKEQSPSETEPHPSSSESYLEQESIANNQSDVKQQSETEQKLEEELRPDPEQDSATDFATETDPEPDINEHAAAEEQLVAEISEDELNAEKLDHPVSPIVEQLEEHMDKQEDAPVETEIQDNIEQAQVQIDQETSLSSDNSQENAQTLTDQENDEKPTSVEISEEDSVQTSRPIEHLEPVLSHDEEPSDALGSLSVDSESNYQVNQEFLGSSDLESQNDKEDHTLQNDLEQPVETNYESVEEEYLPQTSGEKVNESDEEQAASEGGHMEESHYRPSSDMHGQEEGAMTDEEAEAHVDMYGEMSLSNSQENKDPTVAQEEAIVASDENTTSSNVEKEDQSIEMINSEIQNVPDLNQEQLSSESHEAPAAIEIEQDHMKEVTPEEVVNEQIQLETNSEQSFETQEVEDDKHDQTLEIVENTEEVKIDSQPEQVMQEVSADVIKPSFDEEIVPEENINNETKNEIIPEIIEDDKHVTAEEPIKVVKAETDPESIVLVQEETPEDTQASAQESGHKPTEEELEEVSQDIPHKTIHEAVEELLQEAAQALAEKESVQVNGNQNQEESPSATEKPIHESEEETLQALQEDEVVHQAASDEVFSLPENHSPLSEEKLQEEKESFIHAVPEPSKEDYIPPHQIEPEQTMSQEGETIDTEATMPEKNVEEISLLDKEDKLASDELPQIPPQIEITSGSVMPPQEEIGHKVPSETLPAEEELLNEGSEQESIVEKEIMPMKMQDGYLEEQQTNNPEAVSGSEDLQISPEGEHETVSQETGSVENVKLSKPDLNDLTNLENSHDISSDEAISHENQLLGLEDTPLAPEKQSETIENTILENESSNEAIQQVHDLENIIEGAESSDITNNNNPLHLADTLPSEILTQPIDGDETLDEKPISSDKNANIEYNEKIESVGKLETVPENKPIDDVMEAEKIKKEEELEINQATTEQNSDHESPVHPTFELEETQQLTENVNDNKASDSQEETSETQSGANANESEPDSEYVSLVAESETLSTPVAAAAANAQSENSEIEKFEQFEDHHLVNELSEDGSGQKLSEENLITTDRPAKLESSPMHETNIGNDLKASEGFDFNENESVLSILSGLIENEEVEGSGTSLQESSNDDLKAEETVQSQQTPGTAPYYPAILSDLVMGIQSEDLASDKLTTSVPLSEGEESISPEELPFDLSFVSSNDREELMSDNLVVETTPRFYPENSSEDGITTEVPDILEITTQTMLGLASRVTLMEPSAPVATTLKPFMTMEETFSTTASSLNIDPLITPKPVRKRVELGNGPVSLGLNCNNDKQCQLADPYTTCNDQGICDCASKTEAKCSAERTGCSPGTFQCRSSGVCISWFFVCDGRPDCTDASDEECTFNARLNQTCPAESFRCERSGRCISRAALCDGRKQCPHGEDEMECNSLRTESGQCPPNTFRCNSGECLPEYEYCNAIISCKDGSDETPYLCGSQSVPNFILKFFTAGVVDAGRGKSSSRGIDGYCPHRCSNGRCRSTAIVCSGRDGCGDGTDEETCSVCRCPVPTHANASAEFLAQQTPMPLWK